MSDIDEPPSKLVKINSQFAPLAQDETLEGQENGQEEWLSEGVLTDDDFNQSADQDGTNSQLGNTSQDDSQHSNQDQTMDTEDQTQDQSRSDQQFANLSNYEDSRNSIENEALNVKMEVPLNEDLGVFLIRKSDGKVDVVHERKCSSELEEAERQSPEDDDGNNTDELLRLLGDDECKSKKLQALKTLNSKKQMITTATEDTTDDDDFEGAEVTSTLKVAKNASFIKQYQAKKTRQDKVTDSDATDEERSAVKKMFHAKSPKKSNFASKSTTKPAAITSTHKSVLRSQSNNKPVILSNTVLKNASTPTSQPKSLVKSSSNKPIILSDTVIKSGKPQTSTPLKPPQVKSISRPPATTTPPASARSSALPPSRSPAPKPAPAPPKQQPVQRRQITQQPQQYDEEDDMDELCDDMYSEDRLMRPERMDEDMLSDEETEPSDASLYDEMPSSDSEDIEEWFALDIRAERAGDYIPLLGHKAYDLLNEEKKRVNSKLSALRENITALAEKSKEQTQQIEEARRSLAELDALLTHT